jgi:magnesium transporter
MPMLENNAQLLHETLRRYVQREAWDRLDDLVKKTRDEELAGVMSVLDLELQADLWRRLPTAARQAHVICLLESPFGQTVLNPLPAQAVATVLREMAPDDMADILADLEPALIDAVLPFLEKSDEVEDLMRYGEDTAGGIMLPEFLALEADSTIEEALGQIRRSDDLEMIYYTYVVDGHGHLVGVLSLRRLVKAAPSTRVRDVMETDVVSVHTHQDQEQVARLVARYGFLSVPVVDEGNHLLGIVTVDDVLEVLQEEATEDMLKMAGAGQTLAETQGVRDNVRIRFPWLLASCGGGVIGAWVMSVYALTLEAHQFLAFFLPVILGMSGNVGTQAATVTVRALAMGQIRHYDGKWNAVRKEMVIGITLGVMYGVIVGLVATCFEDGPQHAVVIGLSVTAGMIVASSVGASIPVVLHRINIDPAIATGPFVTTSVDVLGIWAYFSIAGLLMGWMY